MRMWNVEPSKMCRRHLLGEHLEAHMFKGCVLKKKSIKGYIKKGLVELGGIKKRHDELVKEMVRRGYNHKSDMSKFNEGVGGFVDTGASIMELKKRCSECKF